MAKYHTKKMVDLTSQHTDRKQNSAIKTVKPNKPVDLIKTPMIQELEGQKCKQRASIKLKYGYFTFT